MAGSTPPARDLPIQEVTAPDTNLSYLTYEQVDEHLNKCFCLLQVMADAFCGSNESVHQTLMIASDEVTHARALLLNERGGVA